MGGHPDGSLPPPPPCFPRVPPSVGGPVRAVAAAPCAGSCGSRTGAPVGCGAPPGPRGRLPAHGAPGGLPGGRPWCRCRGRWRGVSPPCRWRRCGWRRPVRASRRR
ncbi:hypothetical protein C0Q60_05000 [Streptomyces albidoflavus]|nr:hypothetical protein C0Q60_05000 [Streptomyces albidoflavus]RZE03444.1 hypothetical protein C0Q62_04910 [Streptomyces albidoflavus]